MRLLKEYQKVSCIYKILSKINGLFYIGSTNSLSSRWQKHRSELRHNKHGNKYLQHVFNKYGEDNLDFIILEIFSCEICRADLFKREYEYIDRLKPALNLSKKCSDECLPDYPALAEEQAKEYIVSHLEGKEFKIKNLRKFCRDNNLKRNSVACVLSGEYSHTKGWKIRQINEDYQFSAQELGSKFIVQYLDEPEFEINNMRRFIKDKNLSRGAMSAIVQSKMKSHKGWRCRRIHETEFRFKKKVKPFNKIIIYPDGTEKPINNLNEFCRQNGLSKYAMIDVCRGKQSSHKGFKCRNIN